MSPNENRFAPAGRADAKSILADAQQLMTTGLVHHVTHALPSIVLILNDQRQVVYRNQRLMDLLGDMLDEEIYGRRPGEIFNCIHADETSGGCGTTAFCRECGVVKAILKSQKKGIVAEYECRITTKTGGAYEFRVWATSYHVAEKVFTVFSLLNIADEKRRHALERTFFHDLTNILSVLTGCSSFLLQVETQEEASKYIKTIQLACKQLNEEISSYRKLLEVENRQLSVDISSVDSLSLLREVVEVYAGSVKWANRTIIITENSDDLAIRTDIGLIFRILGNMLKNALEATNPGETVSLSCARKESSIVFSVYNPGYMPQSVQLQIFQRSFSTKGTGRGIGTYSMKLFGEKYLKGKVWFSTSEEDGTTFHVSIPIVFPEV